jgi:hypothetical protein
MPALRALGNGPTLVTLDRGIDFFHYPIATHEYGHVADAES